MRVADLEGAALDYWVARAMGDRAKFSRDGSFAIHAGARFEPSTNWKHGGPIIERERPTLEPGLHYGGGNTWKAWIRNESGFHCAYGQTALIAAMRAYVASKFGEEVPDSAEEG